VILHPGTLPFFFSILEVQNCINNSSSPPDVFNIKILLSVNLVMTLLRYQLGPMLIIISVKMPTLGPEVVGLGTEYYT
jgi:hypothetical protein